MTVTAEKRGSVAVLTIDNPPVNALGLLVKKALAEQFHEALADASVKAVVIAGAGKHFSAGADIKEFSDPLGSSLSLPDLIDLIEKSAKPVVAALHGTVAGGALELALGCHYRVAESGAQLSLPEVSLGILPGAGGTVRLPRLVGIEMALDIIVNGRRLSGDQAVTALLVDEAVAPGTVLDQAIDLAEKASEQPPRRTSDSKVTAPPPDILAKFEAGLAKSSRGRTAPHVAFECVKRALTLPFDEALRLERDAFVELLEGGESRALRHVFLAEREAQKGGGPKEGGITRPIESLGVVGCGTMGSGIAMAFANAGLKVVVTDETREAVDRGLAKIRKTYEDSRAKGRLDAAECAARIGRIEGASEYRALRGADLVIEAVFEEMEVKHQVFAQLDAVCSERAILATNTSSLDVDEIARKTKDPSRVIGLHFFSPANIMKLVEIVRPQTVSEEVLSSSLEVVKRIGKIGVVVGVCDGFVGNRMLYAYRRQADFLLEEGALPQQVDRAVRDFGMAMGPYQIGDVAGLDIGWRIRKRQAATRPKNLRYSPIADRLCELGRYGQKTGLGWYRYEKGSREALPDEAVDALVRGVSAELGIVRREITDEEIVQRCFGALVNEGALLLEEGIAKRAGDIDVIWIHGYGFPRHRGGPMHWAGDVGPAKMMAAVDRMHADQGDLVRPSGLLRELARDGRGFGARVEPPQC